jgi:hypothetical protein
LCRHPICVYWKSKDQFTTQFNAVILYTEGQVNQSMPQQTKKQFTAHKATQ